MTALETIEEFLKAWSRKDYKKMYEYCQITWKSNHHKSKLKELISVKIKSWKILDETNVSPHIKDISVLVKAAGEERKIICRVLQELEPYQPSEEGTWGVNPVSVIRNLYK